MDVWHALHRVASSVERMVGTKWDPALLEDFEGNKQIIDGIQSEEIRYSAGYDLATDYRPTGRFQVFLKRYIDDIETLDCVQYVYIKTTNSKYAYFLSRNIMPWRMTGDDLDLFKHYVSVVSTLLDTLERTHYKRLIEKLVGHAVRQGRVLDRYSAARMYDGH